MTNDVAAVILARSDSLRLPNKPLLGFAGGSLIGHVLKRLDPFEGPKVVATSDRSVDDSIADHCAELGVAVFRGSLENVAERALGAACSLGMAWFARINADSPFVDPQLITDVATLRSDSVDLASNLPGRTFPYGVSAEIVRVAALRSHLRRLNDDEREHVTLGLYKHAPAKVATLTSTRPDLRHIRLVVDTADDLHAMRRLADSLADSRTAGWVSVAEKQMQLERSKDMRC